MDALAGVLRLSPAERVRLHRLAASADPGFTCRGDAGPSRLVRPGIRALLDRLEPAAAILVNHAGEAFSRRVREVPGFPFATGVLRLVHPALGGLRLAYETLDLSADDAQRLIVYLPADAATAAAALDGPRSPALRLVAG